MSKEMYVHIDNVSNHVLTSQATFSRVTLPKKALPNAILLLKGRSSLAIYDDYTGFYYIEGKEKVLAFLKQSMVESQEYNWIDFESLDFLHQLTPQEIADLLYISHAKNHLYSPFFYKLQNKYIYLQLGQGFTKVYFRNMDVFYQLLAQKMTAEMSQCLMENQKRLFFRKEKQAIDLSQAIIKELIPYLKVGVVFAFDCAKKRETDYQVPIFLVEDRYQQTSILRKQDTSIGEISYHEQLGWTVSIYSDSVASFL